MDRLRSFIGFIRRGPFRGQHRPIKFDQHSLAAVGESDTVQRMEAREDRADVLASARADREADIVYNVERAAW